MSSLFLTFVRVLIPSLVFFLMLRRPPRSPLFPYTNALPICFPSSRSFRTAIAVKLFVMEAMRNTVSRSTGAFFSRSRYPAVPRSEEHTSELQSRRDLVCRLLLEKKNTLTFEHRLHRELAECM